MLICLNYDSFPKYLNDMLALRQYRGTNILSQCIPLTTGYDLNSFRYFASKTWNSLPNNVKSKPTLTSLRKPLNVIISFKP